MERCGSGGNFSFRRRSGPQALRVLNLKFSCAIGYDDEGFRNPDIVLTDVQLLDNVKAVQRRQNLPQLASLMSFVTRDAKGKAVPAANPYAPHSRHHFARPKPAAIELQTRSAASLTASSARCA